LKTKDREAVIKADEQALLALSSSILTILPDKVEVSCNARVGLMGNPSDGFEGKTLSFLIDNFSAVVTITANDNGTVEIVDPLQLSGLDMLLRQSINYVMIYIF
jgi:glucuronokinase